MPKYYLKCGTLELIHSTDKTPLEAATRCLWESNSNDVLDEYFYIDERGFRDYLTADPKGTHVIKSSKVIKLAGWTLSDKDDEDDNEEDII
jgi:hypothetical protein